MTQITEQTIVKQYRAEHPASRVSSLFKYTHNGSVVRERSCILCEGVSTTWNGNWPRPKGSIAFEREHVATHLEAK